MRQFTHPTSLLALAVSEPAVAAVGMALSGALLEPELPSVLVLHLDRANTRYRLLQPSTSPGILGYEMGEQLLLWVCQREACAGCRLDAGCCRQSPGCGPLACED
ncbi:hypothetical protein V8C34DRAFT_295383 [Trichoderma compactum]